MFEFRSQNPPPVYHGRSSQRRLMMLVACLSLALLVMWQAKNPRNWRWFEFLTSPSAVQVDTTAPPDRATTVVPDYSDEGEFVSAGSRKAKPPDASKPLAERIQRELLESVDDRDAGFRQREADAFFHLLEILAKAEPAAIGSAPAEKVSYLQLWNQSREYRGRWVTLAGTIKRALPQTLPPNDYGLSKYYEVWMRPDGANNPVVIYALDLPEGFPQGASLDEPGSITGFYYRRWWYLAGDAQKPATQTARWAPMLLSRSVAWSPRPAAAQDQDFGLSTLLWAAGAAAALIVLGVIALRYDARETPLPDDVRNRGKRVDLERLSGDAGKLDVHAELHKLSQADDEHGTGA